MRKKSAIIFLLFANICLLAHAALPHHHHGDGTVCFFVHSCNAGVAHDEDGCHNGYEKCSLADAFVKQQAEQDNPKYELPSHALSFIIPNNSIDLRQSASFIFEHAPLREGRYSADAPPSCGSRAPPAALS